MKFAVLVFALITGPILAGCGASKEGKMSPEPADHGFETDTVKTSAGDLAIACIGHGTLMFTFEGKVIHVDPVSREADYSRLPRGDVILVTHGHPDHLDADTIRAIRKEGAPVVLPGKWADSVDEPTVMKNGDSKTVQGLEIRAVPAYNVEHKRPDGNPFHPRGEGNGYVIVFGDKTVYVAGDTENIPEMKELKGIHIAFLPMNLPYTMTPEMAADAARTIDANILYPYHFGKTDTSRLVELLEDAEGMEIRIRKLE